MAPQIDVLAVLTLVSITIVLGYIGVQIFRRSGIPDPLWLMLLGLIVGPGLGLIDTTTFIEAAPLFAAVAILIILFDAGLNLKIRHIAKNLSNAAILTLANFAVAVGIAGLVGTVYGLDVLTAVLIGAIVGGTSSPVILSIVQWLKVRESIKATTITESILTDPLVIVVSIALIQIILTAAPVSMILSSIFQAYALGIVVGLIAGGLWLSFLNRMGRRPFDYILTIAVLVLTYVAAESVNGSGAIAALIFGLVLGNGRPISHLLGQKHTLKSEELLRQFHAEFTFFIRAFFFVFIGLIFVTNFAALIFGLILAAALLSSRILVVHGVFKRSDFTHEEKNLVGSLSARGLSAAVVGSLPLSLGIPGGEFILGATFVVIIVSILSTTVFAKVLVPGKPKRTPEEKKKVKPPFKKEKFEKEIKGEVKRAQAKK